MIVKPDWMGRHRGDDVVLLVCVVGLVVATWAALAQANRVATWGLGFGVSVTIFLALAALTPRTPWAMATRLAMSGWLVVAPWLLAFADLSIARWSHVLASSVIAALAMRGFLYRAVRLPNGEASCASSP